LDLFEKDPMKLANAIEGGITGATTLTLLQEAINSIDPKKPGMKFLQKPGIVKKLAKKKKNGEDQTKLYIQLAGELLSSAAYYGLTAVGKKKNAVLRGGLLGAAAGVGSVLFNNAENDEFRDNEDDDWQNQVITVALYTAGGLLAGYATKKMGKKSKKKKKK
jgi:hypothetical protein